MSFLNQTLGYILFLNGLAFVLLALIAISLCRWQTVARPWRWLVAFGLVRGGYAWLNGLALGLPTSLIYHAAWGAVQLAALGLLIEFGRRCVRRRDGRRLRWWIYLPLLGLVAFGTLSAPVAALHPLGAYLLGLVSSGLAALAFWQMARSAPAAEQSGLRLAAVSLAVCGLIAGLAMPSAASVLMMPSGQEPFLAAIMAPVQLAQTICAGFIAYGVRQVQQATRQRAIGSRAAQASRRGDRYMMLMLTALLIAGWVGVAWAARSADTQMRNQLLTEARMMGQAIDPADVQTLAGAEADLTAPGYVRLKERLAAVRAANSQIRFLYLMGMRADQVFFYVDSEPPDSEDYSPPGQIYEEAAAELPEWRDMFQGATESVTGPDKDRWGVWMSAFAAVRQPPAGQVLALLGMDVDARDWMRALYRAGLLPISLTLLLMTILIGAHVLRSRDQETAWRLAASEERYRLFLQNFIGIAYQSDPQTLRLILFHGTAAEITGYAAEEFLSGRIIWEQLIHPDDRAAARALHEKTVTTPGFVADHLYRIMHRDGNMRWVRDIARYQQGTDSSCIQGVVQDITDRKQAESQREAALEALRAERDRAQGYLDTVETIIVALNREGRITAINRKGCQLLGYAEAELVGQSWFDACLPQPDGMEKVYPYFLRLLAGGQITEYFENPIVTRSGAQRQIAWHNALLRDAQGKIIGTLGSGEDITERVRAEESLQATLAELQRSNAELEQFAYIASHDLQEPLRMVTSFVQLLADRYRGQLDADADEFIGYATDGAKRMQQLILDLLEYSRVGTRGQPPQPTNAAAALADALWNLGLTIEDTRAIVTHDPLPVVLADSVQLSQLFQNLIGNAIKFRGAEPPRVHISARETSPRETFEVSETSKVWEFAVRDNGIGIEPQYFERIFVIFQRLHKRSEYPGTGIGLAICKKIVERHGGRIWVESQPEQGSAFYFTLPAA